MDNVTLAVLLMLAAVLAVWLGIRSRRRAFSQFEEDRKHYTGVTSMEIVDIERSDIQRWEDNDDGSRELRHQNVYLPTYEYTVDGRTYRYSSNHDYGSATGVGRSVPGYYDPADPSVITENAVTKPVLGGFAFFLCAVVMVFIAVNLLLNA